MTGTPPDVDGETGTPRWVTLVAIALVVLLLLVVVLAFTGGHGPGVHSP